jgi:hypothetical protein
MKLFMAKSNRDDLAVLRGLLADGQVTPVIDRTYPLSEVPEALRYLEQGLARARSSSPCSPAGQSGRAGRGRAWSLDRQHFVQVKYGEQAADGPAWRPQDQGAADRAGLMGGIHQDIDAAGVDEAHPGEIYHQIGTVRRFHRARDGIGKERGRRHVHLSGHLNDDPRRTTVRILPLNESVKCLD